MAPIKGGFRLKVPVFAKVSAVCLSRQSEAVGRETKMKTEFFRSGGFHLSEKQKRNSLLIF